MDNLFEFLPHTESEGFNWSNSILNKFCIYLNSDASKLNDISYWNDIHKLLCLLFCLHKYFESNSVKSDESFQILISTSINLFEFSVAFLNRECKYKNSLQSAILNDMICSLFVGIFNCRGFLSSDILSIAFNALKNERSVLIHSRQIQKSLSTNYDESLNLDFTPISESNFDYFLSTSSSNYGSSECTISALISVMSIGMNSESPKSNQLSEKTLLGALVEKLSPTFKPKNQKHRIVSLALSFVQFFKNSSFDFAFFSSNFQFLQHNIFSFNRLTSIPQLFNRCSFDDFYLLSEAAFSILRFLLFIDYCLNFEISSFGESPNQDDSAEFLLLDDCFLYSFIGLALEACDNVALIFSVSQEYEIICRNFRALQASIILKHLSFILQLSQIEECNKIMPLKSYFSVVFIQVSSWLLNYLQNNIFTSTYYNSFDSIPNEISLFASNNEFQILLFLFQNFPILNILVSLTLNSHIKSAAVIGLSAIKNMNDSSNASFHVTSVSSRFCASTLFTFLYTHISPLSKFYDSTFIFKLINFLFNGLKSESFHFELDSFRANYSFAIGESTTSFLENSINLVSVSDDALFHFSKLSSSFIPLPPPDIINEQLFIHDISQSNLITTTFSKLQHCSVNITKKKIISFKISQSLFEMCLNSLKLLRTAFAANQKYCMSRFIGETLVELLLPSLSLLLTEFQEAPFRIRTLIPYNSDMNSSTLLSCFHNLLMSGYISESHQLTLLESLGIHLEKWPLFIPDMSLYVLSRIIFLNMKLYSEFCNNLCVRFWNSFLDSLERNFCCEQVCIYNDINHLHILLFLFCFHHLNFADRKDILTRIICLIHLYSKQKIDNAVSCLASCRLSMILEYLLFHFSKIPISLYNLIRQFFWDTSLISQIQIKSPQNDILLNECYNKLNDKVSCNFHPRFYEIFDRCGSSLVDLDDNFLKIIFSFEDDSSLITYPVIYSDLLLLSYNFVTYSYSSTTYSDILFNITLMHRFNSINNMLSYLPAIFSSIFPDLSTLTFSENFEFCFKTLMAKETSLNADLSKYAFQYYNLSGLAHDEINIIQTSQKNLFSNPFDRILMSETFFSKIFFSKEFNFHILIFSSSFAFILFEALLDLENLSFNELKEFLISSQFSNFTQLSLSEYFCDSSKLTNDEGNNVLSYFIIPEGKNDDPGDCSTSKSYILEVFSKKIIPILLKVLDIVSNYCSDFFIQISSNEDHYISKQLLSLATVSSSSNNLTFFSNNCNFPLFDTFLVKPLKHIFSHFRNIPQNNDHMQFIDNGYVNGMFRVPKLIHAYFFNISNADTFGICSIFKHTFSMISSLLQKLFHWCSINEDINCLTSPISEFIHYAPLTSLYSGYQICNFVPESLIPFVKEKAAFYFLENCFLLISFPNFRLYNYSADILNNIYSIMMFCLKDLALFRILCSIFCRDQPFDFFSIITAPIYSDFRLCISLSINIFAELIISLKTTTFNESKGIIFHLNDISSISSNNLFHWFENVLLGYENENEKCIESRCDKLLVLANAISTGGTVLDSDTCQFFLKAIIPLGFKLLDYLKYILLKPQIGTDVNLPGSSCDILLHHMHPCLNSFLPIITGLAEVHNVKGELLILESVLKWLPICRDIISEYLYSIENKSYEDFVSDFISPCCFISDLLEQIKLISTVVKMLKVRDGSSLPYVPVGIPIDHFEGDIVHIAEWDEFGDVYDENENKNINEQLCTYTITNKDYMKQHWYHCYTCKLCDSSGVCTLCAKVCHKGHDVSYAKNSAFFCDCGARGERFCRSLYPRKRTINFDDSIVDQLVDSVPTSCNYEEFQSISPDKRKLSSSVTTYDDELSRLVDSIEQDPVLKEQLYSLLEASNFTEMTISILKILVLSNKKHFSISPLKSYISINRYFEEELLKTPITFEYPEGLAVCCLGAPEGAIENVKLTFGEEHGGTCNSESLLTSSCIKRNAFCLTIHAVNNRNQYLIVSLDKGKILTLHFSLLFKSETSNKKKATISKVHSVISSFSIISMAFNHFNIELIAFCGVRDCSIYTVNHLGQIVGSPLVVHIGIEASNYILKSFWLPISSTTLCIITSHFVKIYELSIDCYSPIFFFSMNSDTFADCTFISTDSLIYLVLMTNSGLIYLIPVNLTTGRNSTPSYFEVKFVNDDISNSDSKSEKSGVSIYFSHSLQLIFFSFSQGLNYFAAFNEDYTKFTKISPIKLGNSNVPKVLCQWSECYQLPGLICSQILQTSAPVILNILSKRILVHEVKCTTKTKIQGIILAFNFKYSSLSEKASLVLLFDDGSLKIFYLKLDQDQLQDNLYYFNPLMNLQRTKRKCLKSSTANFPIDFFENCLLTEDIEFGGIDVLHIYNQDQIKKRLNSEFLSIANSRPLGFKIEILSTNSSNILVGFRIYLGNTSITQTPSFIEIFNRQRNIELTSDKPRWFDFPFTRDESLRSNKKFIITFGPSRDPSCVNFIDSIKVYCQSKEEFGMFEASEMDNSKYLQTIPRSFHNEEKDEDLHSASNNFETELDRFTNLTITLFNEISHSLSHILNEEAVTLASQLLICLLDNPLKEKCDTLLFSLFPNIDSFYLHRDESIFIYVVGRLYLTPICFFTPELFQHIIFILHSIAIRRPRNLEKLLNLTYIRWCCEQYVISTNSLPLLQIPQEETFKDILEKIFDTFWFFWNSRPLNPCLASVKSPGIQCIKETLKIISGIIYSFIVNDSSLIPCVVGFIFEVLKCKEVVIWDSFLFSFSGHFKTKISQGIPKSKISFNTEIIDPLSIQGAGFENISNKPGFGKDVNSQNFETFMQCSQKNEKSDDVNLAKEPFKNSISSNNGISDGEVFDPMKGKKLDDPLVLSEYELDPNQPINEDSLMNLALAISMHDHDLDDNETKGRDVPEPSSDENNNIVEIGSSSESNAYSLENKLESTSDHMIKVEMEFSGEQSSTGTLTPPVIFSPPFTQLESSTKTKKVVHDKFSEISSDQYGDSSGDDIDASADSNTMNLAKLNEQIPGRKFHDVLCQDLSLHTRNDIEFSYNLNSLLFFELVAHIEDLMSLGGIKAILYMKLVLTLLYSLEFAEQNDRPINACIFACIDLLQLSRVKLSSLLTHTYQNEVILILIRFLSLLLVRGKQEKEISSNKNVPNVSSAWFITATALLNQTNFLNFCLNILREIINGTTLIESETINKKSEVFVGSTSPNLCSSDFVPFFHKQYSKEKTDIFEDYPKLLIETIMRIPFQLKKICDTYIQFNLIHFDPEWLKLLCEYMALSTHSQIVSRRNVRKLMLCISGSKEEYRKIRDFHVFNTNINNLKSVVFKSDPEDFEYFNCFYPEYDDQIKLLHCISHCIDLCLNRPENWQFFCFFNPDIIAFLVRISCRVHEDIAGGILHLLSFALCGVDFSSEKLSKTISMTSMQSIVVTQPNSTERTDTYSKIKISKFASILIPIFLLHSSDFVDNSEQVPFLSHLLLCSNSEILRSQAQSLIWHVFVSSNALQKTALFEFLCSNIHLMARFGYRATQLVTLLCRCSEMIPPDFFMDTGYITKLVDLLKNLNQHLLSHPNSYLYLMLSNYIDCDGFFLENVPCFVCNNPEVPFSSIKLMSIKVDGKFTGHSIIIKLSNCFIISGFNMKITDIKRSKMVRTINIFYSNKNFQSAVEMKNRKESWISAKEVALQAGQHELKIQLPLPIIACNIVIEYSDFYESIQNNPETLQCPRCSAPVPAIPGICGNCSENVFQCHKCRAINYDEKDPFLCNSCGYSKFGKFEFSLIAKSCPTIEAIETEDDRKKNINTITTLLEKADQIYQQLLHHRHVLDILLSNGIPEELPNVGKLKADVTIPGLNKFISTICQRYCIDCKSTFNEFCKVIQGVVASRQEIIKFDLKNTPNIKYTLFSSGSHLHSTTNDLQVSNLSNCYGCLSNAIKHCINFLKILSKNPSIKQYLVNIGILYELCNKNLRLWNPEMQKEVQELIVSLSKNDTQATSQLMQWLKNRITFLIQHQRFHHNFAIAAQYHMQLLTTIMDLKDNCWDERLRTLMIIFYKSTHSTNSVILEYITLPCLKIILQNINYKTRASDKFFSLTPFEICKAGGKGNRIHIKFNDWLETGVSVNIWKINCDNSHEVLFKNNTWLKNMLFHPSCNAARVTACSLILSLMTEKHRRKIFVDLLIEYLPQVVFVGETAHEYLEIFQNVISDYHWRVYIASQGVLILLGKLLNDEVVKLNILEDSTMNVDITLGYTLKMLSSILFQIFCPAEPNEGDMERNFEKYIEVQSSKPANISVSTQAIFNKQYIDDPIFKDHKPKLLPLILNCYLSLKRLIIQRTKRIDDAQDNLLQILELMTSGTIEETHEFIEICIGTLSKFPPFDFRTPIVVFEELCNIIYPEESEPFEFFLCFEKESQQEEFLQGRMQNNPYSSNDSSIGQLMRDIKNKICRDTELLALLEEDTGLELLVCNKIINLDLTVKSVFKNVWISSQPNSGNIMKVIYRMRGLLGEATEDIIDNFSCENDSIDDEEKFKVASKMSQCGGLESILDRLKCLQNPFHSLKFLTISLKLLSYCVKLKINRKYLLKGSLNSIDTLLSLFKATLSNEEQCSNPSGKYCIEALLDIIFEILQEASSLSFVRLDSNNEFSEKVEADTCHLRNLLSCIGSSYVQNHTDILKGIMRIIPFLTYGDVSSMQLILDHFSKYLNYEGYDEISSSEHSLYLECFCSITSGISSDDSGISLKDLLIESGHITTAIEYVQLHTPPPSDSEWPIFLDKPSLPYILKFLAGISRNHITIQSMIGNIIPQLHSLENVTTIKGIGSLAENVLNALVDNKSILDQVAKCRDESFSARKKKAEAYQQMSLSQLGISLSGQNEKLKFWEEVESLKEETGLICCICMEGYCNHPRKILGIYTYSKSCVLEEYENKPRKTQGYSTVSGFNVVHLDCHNTAVRTSRQSRGKDEWESASIHNSNIKCNSIMPIWGPEVQDNGFYSCLAKHHSCLQEATGCREPNYWSSVHDIKLLILRYTTDTSFCNDTGGGSKYSNICFLGYMVGYSFHLLLTSRSFPKELSNVSNFLECSQEKYISSHYELDGPAYFLTSSVFILSYGEWSTKRLTFLQRIIIIAHSRYLSSNASSVEGVSPQDCLEFGVYRPYLILFGFVDKIQLELKKFNKLKGEEMVSKMVEEYRTNDKTISSIFENLLSYYDEDLLPAESFAEFCDVLNLLTIVDNPNEYLTKVISANFKSSPK